MSSVKKVLFFTKNKKKQICSHPFSVVDLQLLGSSDQDFAQTPESIEETYRPLLARNQETLLTVADPDSFAHVGGRFFRDRSQLYIFCNKNDTRNDVTWASTFFKAYKQVDFSSFEVLSEHMAMDAKTLFFSSGHSIKKSKNFELIRSPKIDAGQSFGNETILLPNRESDSPAVQENLEAINSLATLLSTPAASPVLMVDPQGKSLFTFDPSGLSKDENIYFTQRQEVYYFQHPLPGVNAETFRHLAGAYFTDGRSIYCGAEKLNCDHNSFLVLDEDPYRATDRYRSFYRAGGSALRPEGQFASRGVAAFFARHSELKDYWYFQKFLSPKFYASKEGLFYQGYPVATKEGSIQVRDSFSLKSLSQSFTQYEYGFCSIDDRLYYKLSNYIYFQAMPEGDVGSFREINDKSFEDCKFLYTIEYGKLKIRKRKTTK